LKCPVSGDVIGVADCLAATLEETSPMAKKTKVITLCVSSRNARIHESLA
jgi:hypothetical protein